MVRYDARDDGAGISDLRSVTVRRGGVEYDYRVEELVGVQIVHFKGNAGETLHVSTPRGRPAPEPSAQAGDRSRRGLLEVDRDLNTGVVNLGGGITALTGDPVMNDVDDPRNPNTPGMAIRFVKPVVNDVGPDVVMFEYQPVIQPEDGDPFHISPLHFSDGLHSRTYRRWDLGIYSPEALILSGFRLNHFEHSIDSTTTLENDRVQWVVDHMPTSKALAVAIDLSDLGYAPGTQVEGLFIQDAPIPDASHMVDPVFIGGLPNIKR